MADVCTVEPVTVEDKAADVRIAHNGRINYWLTVRTASGDQERFTLADTRTRMSSAFWKVALGQPVYALVFRQRVAMLAINGQALPTSDDPDVGARANIARWIGALFLLALAAYSLYCAWVVLTQPDPRVYSP